MFCHRAGSERVLGVGLLESEALPSVMLQFGEYSMVKLGEPRVAFQDWLCSSFVLLLWEEQLVPAVPWLLPSVLPLGARHRELVLLLGPVGELPPLPVPGAPGSAAGSFWRQPAAAPAQPAAPLPGASASSSGLPTSLRRCSCPWPLKSSCCRKPPDSDCFFRLMVSYWFILYKILSEEKLCIPE